MAKKKSTNKNIGIKVDAPLKTCDDAHCPFHGSIKTRGATFVATVVKNSGSKGAIVQWYRRRLVPKYERYETRRTKLVVHKTPCIEVAEGDKVRIMETRPISKTKHFVIVEKIGVDVDYLQKAEGMEEAKAIHKESSEPETQQEVTEQ